MTKVIVSFPWESISQLNKFNSRTKKKTLILCSCFILLNFIPLRPVISPSSSLSSHHFHYLLSSIIYSLITAPQMQVIFGSLLLELRRGQSYLSVLWSLLSAVLNNPVAFWSRCWGRTEGRLFSCYSKLQTELGILVLLRQGFSESLTHTIPAFLTFWQCGTHGSMNHRSPKSNSPLKSIGSFKLIDAGTPPPLHGSLGIMFPLFPMGGGQ